VGVLLGSLAIALVAVELSLRAFGAGDRDEESWRVEGLYQPDPALIYSMKPDSEHRSAREEPVVVIEATAPRVYDRVEIAAPSTPGSDPDRPPRLR